MLRKPPTPTLLRLTLFSTLSTSLKWRSEIHHRDLAAEISSILLHRKSPIPLLRRRFNDPSLPHRLPSLLLRVLRRTRSHPDLAFRFFLFARSTLAFSPDLPSIAAMTQILVGADLLPLANQLLGPVLRSHPPAVVIDSILATDCKDSRSKLLSFLLESYSNLNSINISLDLLKEIHDSGYSPSTGSWNALLEAFVRLPYALKVFPCCYAVVLRSGTAMDDRSWYLIARLLCSEGMPERAELLLGLGICEVACYDLVMDCYCCRGDLTAALRLLDEMRERNLSPGFGTYSSILDGGCKFGDNGVVDLMLQQMAAYGFLRTVPFLEYDWVITSLCGLEKTYAAEMFFQRAKNVNFRLGNNTYSSMLRAFSDEGRMDRAMQVYEIMLREDIELSRSSGCYDVFLDGICKGEPSSEANRALRDLIGQGFLPSIAGLSKYIGSQCSRGCWREASDLLNFALEKGVLMESLCCCSLMEHYCTTGLLDSAILMHNKIKRLGGCLDLSSYDLLLKALVSERRIKDATGVFDYMRARNVLGPASFVIMITTLCREKEMRKAMNLHDEMLKLGLKPDDTTYKSLITGFA